MTLHITDFRDGFPMGTTRITHENDANDNAPITLEVVKLAEGESVAITAANETAWLLMNGAASGTVGGAEFSFERSSLFDESSSCFHVSAGTEIQFQCSVDTEFTVFSCNNTKPFDARVFSPADVANEPRGKGQTSVGRCRYETNECQQCEKEPWRRHRHRCRRYEEVRRPSTTAKPPARRWHEGFVIITFESC